MKLRKYWKGALFSLVSLAVPLTACTPHDRAQLFSGADPVLIFCCVSYFLGATYLSEWIMQTFAARLEESDDVQPDTKQ